MTSQRGVHVTTVSEYSGQTAIRLGATQLGTQFTATAARRVVQEWVEFFASGPSPLRELAFTSRTPARLFAALEGQTQLSALAVKWGDYADLSPIAGMSGLRHLELRGASKVTDIEPLGGLQHLETLAIEGFHSLDNPAPLGRLTNLTDLELGGKWQADRNGHLASLEFLRELPKLEELLLHTLVVDSLDYTPVLSLRRLKKVRFMAVRGMQPSIEDLKAALPWSG